MKILCEMLKMTATKNEIKLWFLGVQIFGVKSVPAKFITLMKCHTEKRRAQVQHRTAIPSAGVA